MKGIIVYLVIINIVSFLIYGVDKYKAIHNKWRISENFLMGLALAGGFAGAFAGMQLFRHKTKHIKFVIGVPLITVLWFIIFFLYAFKLI